MRKRLSSLINLCAFGLLFFALYLNFIHKDSNTTVAVSTAQEAAAQGTVLVSNPDQYIKKSQEERLATSETPATKHNSYN